MCEKYNSNDRYFLRARTFIMSCFDDDIDIKRREVTIQFLLTVVRGAEQQRLRRLLDPERYKIEIIFIHLIQDIIIASRNDNGPGPL